MEKEDWSEDEHGNDEELTDDTVSAIEHYDSAETDLDNSEGEEEWKSDD